MSLLTTFIVEDSPVIRDSLIGTLEELGPVNVAGWADDEAGAVQRLGQPGHEVDLVIVDIFLKGGSGLGVLRAARAMLLRAHLVVFSNYATADMRQRCLQLGADRVFDKSGEIDALIEYCHRLALLQATAAVGGHGTASPALPN
jgi:DNA-binding NarL/FixJ family response regulator